MGQQPKIVTMEQLLAAKDLGEELVDVPEWGGHVKVQGLSVKAVNDANKRATVAGELDPELIAVEVLIAGMVDPQPTPEHAGQLAAKSMGAVNRVVQAIYKLSGISDEQIAGNEARFPEGAE